MLSLTGPRVGIGLALATLPDCFPYVTNYAYLERPGVTHRRAPCYDGAPMGAVYEKGGVRFELALEPHALSPLRGLPQSTSTATCCDLDARANRSRQIPWYP